MASSGVNGVKPISYVFDGDSVHGCEEIAEEISRMIDCTDIHTSNVHSSNVTLKGSIRPTLFEGGECTGCHLHGSPHLALC